MTKGVLKRVFRYPRYFVGASFVAFLVFSAALLLPNWSAIVQVVSSGAVSVSDKLLFLFTLYGTLTTNFTFFSIVLLTFTAISFGLNIALLTFYIRRRQEASRGTVAQFASLGGLFSALLGIGCAACGSVVLTAVLGLFGATGLLLLLPFGGAEFGVLGIILLIISIRYLLRRIDDPIICPSKY
ncbi:hypothetical protein GW937_01030 [Candidatus Kaiserbacteria bacterium]|nr:hypothetical protein [Candidatus Kaiserbacteria bacterium]NCT02256.1 hypothetical protein [Candidatus Parcubacteria bacterium]